MSPDQELGKVLTLYSGVKVRVAAMPMIARDEFTDKIYSWLRGLAGHPEGITNGDVVLNAEALPVDWRHMLVFILTTSNPGQKFDADWCTKNLHYPDLAAIVKVWIEENHFEPLIQNRNELTAEVPS